MNTKLKQIGYITGIFLACIFCLLITVLAFLSDSKVQTSVVKVITHEVSRALGTDVHIDKLSYKLFSRIEVDGIYIADQQKDTLLYVERMQARFNFWKLFKKEVYIKHITLQQLQGNIVQLPNGEMNFAFIQKALANPEKQALALPHMEVQNVTLTDSKLQLLDYAITNLHTQLALHCLSMDSINAEIVHLQFKEQHGFDLEDFTAHLIVNKQGAKMPRLKLQMPASQLEAQRVEITFPTTCKEDTTICSDSSYYILEGKEEGASVEGNLFQHLTHLKHAHFLAHTHIDLQITHAQLSPTDIRRFVPALENIKGIVDFSGHVEGKLNALHAKGLALDYASHQILRGNVSLYGLPVIDTTHIDANLQDLRIDHAMLQDLIADLQNKPYTLPTGIQQLGVMHYHGFLTGKFNNMKLHGAFNTDLGSITTEGILHAKDQYQTWEFRGHIGTERFALGKVLDQPLIGDIALQTDIHFLLDSTQQMTADLCADIPFIQFHDYTYQHAHIDGLWSHNQFNGEMHINDPNIGVSFNGMVDLAQEQPMVDFRVDVSHFRMGELNLSEKYSQSDLRFGMQLNAVGNSPDNVQGALFIDTITFLNKDKMLYMDQFRIIAHNSDEYRSLKIQSDYLNANVEGKYTYTTLLQTLQSMLLKYMPQSLNTQQREYALQEKLQNQITYYAYLQDIDLVCEVLELPLLLTGMPTIKGFVDETQNAFSMQMVVPELQTATMDVQDITMNLNNNNEQLNLSLYLLKQAGERPASAKMGDLTCLLKTQARNDSIFLGFDFTNDDNIQNAGSINLQTYFTQYNEKPQIDIEFLPSALILNDSTWNINNSHIIYTAADTTLQVQDFRFASSDRFIAANGIASTKDTDSIRLDLQGIILDYILGYTNVADAAISFGGELTGWGVLYGLFNTPKFEADVEMLDATINNGLMGDATATARWNRERKTVDILGQVVEKGDTVAKVDGIVTPKERKWDLQIQADSVNLEFIQGWTQNIFSEIKGRGYGWVHVFGEKKKTWVEGKAMAQNGCIGLGMLGTQYWFTDSVTIDIDRIRFDSIPMQDKEGNKLLVNGYVQHDSLFHDFRYNIQVNCEEALVMELPENAQDMFYGKVYGTGQATIRGDELECRIRANARTDAQTDFYLSLATASSARDNSFITFVQHDTPQPLQNTYTIRRQYGENSKRIATVDEGNTSQLSSSTPQTADRKPQTATKVFLDLQIEATPAANVTLIIDPKTGDHLNARGEGNLKLSYDLAADDIKLYGNYALNTGSFFFTFQNVIRKEFSIREGSRVYFTGDPMNIQIDASAAYSTTASLKDLFGTDFEQISTNRTSVPVNCLLYMKDQLMNPTLSFGIELPQSDESVASQVRSVISTEDMMMRQILYLLVFNKFYTPEYLQATTNTVGLNETYSLISSTVTGQINNWLSKMTDDFTIGFNMRADGLGAESSQEYETQFQYQYNNRLLINGNFGYRYNDISNQPLFGNLDVEYLLTPSGHWRAKAYTHTVDKYSMKEAHTVQGVGLMFKYDFNGKEKKNKKKDTSEPSDSTTVNVFPEPVTPIVESQDSIPTDTIQ